MTNKIWKTICKLNPLPLLRLWLVPLNVSLPYHGLIDQSLNLVPYVVWSHDSDSHTEVIVLQYNVHMHASLAWVEQIKPEEKIRAAVLRAILNARKKIVDEHGGNDWGNLMNVGRGGRFYVSGAVTGILPASTVISRKQPIGPN